MGDARVTGERGGGGSGQFGENSDATTGGARGDHPGKEGGLNLVEGYIRLGMRGIPRDATALPMQRAPKMCVLL